ncbi:holo-ACP synthase [Leptospira perolatii]|uniref:holo-ACP synthase n=1 Tax=Leptospira perolatii TaxID=2023191 RepID=UPI001FAFA1D4|nr:holo-ACP synthase [Leptospira perolatii]
MKYSLGVDLVYVMEFQRFLEDSASSFFEKTFTEVERSIAFRKPFSQRALFYSGRFAAKEAFVKALDGPRLHLPPELKISYPEIEIRNDEFGRPFYRFYGELSEYLRKLNFSGSQLSLSHSGDYAIAYALIEY